MEFLDYHIIENSDGIMLSKKSGDSWEWHLGYYSTFDDAKIGAIRNFMICRPEIFHGSIEFRLMGNRGSYHEWFNFERCVVKMGLEMPDEITPSTDSNFLITYKGKLV